MEAVRGLQHAYRADEYTYRVPTPPRITVPPPTLNAEQIPEISFRALKDPEYAFLKQVDYSNLVQQNAPLDWSYERRREAQDILPFLCLGPMTSARDEPWLQRNGITMLLGIRQKQRVGGGAATSRAAQNLGLEHHSIDLATNADLIQNFSRITQLINAHLARNHSKRRSLGNSGGRDAQHGAGRGKSVAAKLGKVLVFCESGNERGAGVVAAYLMETHDRVDHIKAMQLVQAQRFCVNFDDSMKYLLSGYWDILCAKREVEEGSGNNPSNSNGDTHVHGTIAGAQTPNRTNKRGLERDNEGDEDAMDIDEMDEDDRERFGGRTFAPFVNQPSHM